MKTHRIALVSGRFWILVAINYIVALAFWWFK